MRHCCVAVVVVAALAGCGETEAGYFPLERGWNWGYRVIVDTKNLGKATYRSYVSNLSHQTLGDHDVIARLVHDGGVYYYADEADGIHRIASAAGGEGFALAPPGHYVLKRPLEAGTSWQVADRTYLLKRQVFYTGGLTTFQLAVELQLEYVIEAVDDVVTVPAGTFRRCVRIRGVGTTTHELGHPFKMVTVEVETTEWFAPGVGLVKLVRRENTRPENYMSGEMVKELEVFDKGAWLH